MGSGATKQQIARKLRTLKRKFPDETFVTLRASNGEVAIVSRSWLESTRVSDYATGEKVKL